MSYNLESSNNEVNETPQIAADSEQLAETEATAESFDDCALSEVHDSNGKEVGADSLEETEENYDDCAAKAGEMADEHPELADDGYDDFSDCGKETKVQDEITQVEYEAAQEEADEEKEEVSPDEISKLKEEHAAELKAKIEERNATEEERKSKFDEVLSKEKGSEEYQQALQEYNALQDQKTMLDEQIAQMEKQQDLLEQKSPALQEPAEKQAAAGAADMQQKDAAEMSGERFGAYEVDPRGFVKGDNYDRFIRDWEGYSADRYKTEMFDQAREQTISPSLVEGIRVSDHDVENPSAFWSQHESGGTVESFEEIAANIPEVRDRLAAGETLDDLIADPRVGSCASIYFHPDNMPEVIRCGDYYEFQSNGRHRILAARNLGYDIPVKVIGERTIEAPDAEDTMPENSATTGGIRGWFSKFFTQSETAEDNTTTETPELLPEESKPTAEINEKQDEATEKNSLSEDAIKALEKIPENSEFNDEPQGDISGALECYCNWPYSKESEQYKAIFNHCHDTELSPLREELFRATERCNEQAKEVDRIKDLVSGHSEQLSPLEAQQIRNELLRAEFTLSICQRDVSETTRRLSEEAERVGVDATVAQRKFVGFNGNSDFDKAYDGYITSKQTGGTCGINYCASVRNQQTDTRITQKEAVTEFATLGLCGESKDINSFGGTSFYDRQKYFEKHSLQSECIYAENISLEDMAERFENGESIGIALHAQDLGTPEYIDAQSRQPRLVSDADGNVCVEVDDFANHMVTVAGFDRTPDGRITTVYINDTGGWNRVRDASASGGGVGVNRIPIPAEKYYAMCKNTNGMFVEFVSK